MSTDLPLDQPLGLARACLTFPELSGRGATPALLVRWITRGVRGHRLNAERFGGRYQVRRGDVQRFLAEINGKPAAEAKHPVALERKSWLRAELALVRL